MMCAAGCQMLAGSYAMAQENTSILVVMKEINTKSASLQDAKALFQSRSSNLLLQSRHDGYDIRIAPGFKPTKHILKGQLLKWQVPKSQVEAVLQELNNNPKVAYAEPDHTVYLDDYQYRAEPSNTPESKPDDLFFDKLWGLHNEGQTGGAVGADIDAMKAWEVTKGSGEIAVGVIDTGIDYTHPDLVDNMWTNPNEIPGDGIDNDNNGYVDDMHGINSYDDTGDPMDTHSHGTHVAGTIGATGNNGVGVTGVNHKVSLIGCKFIKPSGGGSISDAIKCLDYFIDLKLAGTDIRLTNNSWGGGSRSEAMIAALQRSHDAGMLFISSAGNAGENNDEVAHYPSSYDSVDSVMAVAATTHSDYKSGFSNYGRTSVDLGAPGSSIYSTVPNDGYSSKSGTSMASPHAAGAAALLLAANPGLTHIEVKALLMETGDPLDALANNTVSGKRINVANAIEAASNPSWYIRTDLAAGSIKQGETAQFDFTVQSINNWQGDVALEVSGDLNATISSNPLPAGGSATISVLTAENTPVGDYQLTLTARSGDTVRTQIFNVTVEYANLETRHYANNNSYDIPDNNQDGVRSTINVADDLSILSGEVTVDISHTWRGDLVVVLESPSGQTQTLHNRSGGRAADLKKTWQLTQFTGSSQGEWHLFVTDLAGSDVGTINKWSMTLTGTTGDQDPVTLPTADFVYDADSTKLRFNDRSTDDGLDIYQWHWDFGDGNTSTEQNPEHTYADEGSYQVTLTVTDRKGNTDSISKTIDVAGFTISLAQQTRLDNGDVRLRFTFAGSDAIFIYFYRDDRYVRSVFNTGDTTETLSNPQVGSEFIYKMCDSKGCTNDLTVSIE